MVGAKPQNCSYIDTKYYFDMWKLWLVLKKTPLGLHCTKQKVLMSDNLTNGEKILVHLKLRKEDHQRK